MTAVPVRPVSRRLGRIALAAASSALVAVLLAGCGDEGSNVSCSLDSCKVTFDRGVDAKASILGVDVELQGVRNDQVTVKVAGQEISVPVGTEQGQAEAGGLRFQVQEVTDSKVVMKVSKA
jgi:hypothetical protein